MPVLMSQETEALRKRVSEFLHALREDLQRPVRGGRDFEEHLNALGELAHELHMKLKEEGSEPRHHAYMVTNRGMQPDHPDFYKHLHPVEDLLKFTEDPSANDDPVDITIGEEFTLRCYSRRWGHDDAYTLVRTPTGWDFKFNMHRGPCDRSGRPFLFKSLRHDSIQYPSGLESHLAWLWEKAAKAGLSKEQVQRGLDELGHWISLTEMNTPSGDIWDGLC